MITYLGEEVWPDGKGFPKLYSIGVALGRIPRFAGHTKEWYPVLAHTLTVAKILPPQYALYGLLHDAQEACMSDVPTPWKLKAVHNLEMKLLKRIYGGNDLEWPISPQAQAAVNWADAAALAAEAHVLGHPAADKVWPEYDPHVAKITKEHLKIAKTFLEANIAGEKYQEAFAFYLKQQEEVSNLPILEAYDINPNTGCWDWNRSKNTSGYGQIRIKGKLHRANRYWYEMYFGKIPQGAHVMHTCDNPSCVNPKHLRVGTHADNMRDMKLKGRQVSLKGSENGNAKLSEVQVADIRSIHSAKKTPYRKLASDFGVGSSTIARIVNNQSHTG